jgi:hypothetical protein
VEFGEIGIGRCLSAGGESLADDQPGIEEFIGSVRDGGLDFIIKPEDFSYW